MIESNDPEWGLCDHGPLLPADYRDDEEDYDEEWDEYGSRYDDDDESPSESLARVIAEIEAMRGEHREALLREVRALRHLGSRPQNPSFVHDGRRRG